MRPEDPATSVGTTRKGSQNSPVPAPAPAPVPDTKTDRRGNWGRSQIPGVVIVLCALVAALVAADYAANAGEIYRGVYAGSVSLGGKTPGEARGFLQDRATRTLVEIRLTGPKRSTLGTKTMDVDVDVATTVQRAYEVGRTGGLLDRLGGRASAAFGAARVAPAVEYRPKAVRAAVEGLASRVNRKPRAASVVVRGTKVEVIRPEAGYELDVAATTKNVTQAVEDLGDEAPMAGKVIEPEISALEAEEAAARARRALSGAVVLTAGERRWELSPAEIGRSITFAEEGGKMRVALDRKPMDANLDDVYAALSVEPVEANYRVSGTDVTPTPSREGRRVEAEKLLGAMEKGLPRGERAYEVPVAVVEPELTTSEAKRLKPTKLLGSYRTNYSIVPDTGARVENLQLSSGAITGTLLAPGEVFSMNDTVSGLDYNESKVIVNGRETKADGGGLCQVTSTLYNAVNEAGLDVTERSPHYAQLPYIRPGLDATVWFGDGTEAGELDMEFENTSDGYVLLREYVAQDGYIYAEVWGSPSGTEVKTWSEPVYRNADSAKWVTYQTIRKDGKVLYDGVLHRDTYEALKDEKGKPIPADVVPIAPVDP